MTRNEIKHREQISAIKLWLNNKAMGIVSAVTGFGKTRLGVLAGKGYTNKYGKGFKILIITPTETIRDNAWKEEFTKWGAKKVFKESVTTVCIQTAYKWEDTEWDLVVLDEAHNYTSSEYSKFFENNTAKRILGLSATLDKEQQIFYNKLGLPIVYNMPLKKAKELKLVSDYNMYNYGVELSASEQYDYDQANKTFMRTFPTFNRDLNLMFKCMDKDFFKDYCANKGLNYEEVEHYPFQCNNAISKRKSIIYDCKAKITAIKEISELMQGKLGIVFAERTQFADKVTEELGDVCVSFHSKIKKKQRTANLKRLTDGRTKVNIISTGKALNEGANIPRCTFGVIASGTGKPRATIQRIGRSIRFEEGKVATIIRLYVKNSQEEKWVQNAQKDLDAEFINDLNQIEI